MTDPAGGGECVSVARSAPVRECTDRVAS